MRKEVWEAILAKTNNWHKDPSLWREGCEISASCNPGFKVNTSPSYIHFVYALGLFPLTLFPSLEINPGPLTVGVLRGFEATR